MKLRAFRLGFLGSLAITAALASAPASAATVVALGASNTFGKGVARNQAYPAQLESILRAKGANVRVVNAGINGDTTEGMLRRLDQVVPKGTSAVILQARRQRPAQGLARSDVGNSKPAERPRHPGDHDSEQRVQGITASAGRPASDPGRLPHARRTGCVPGRGRDRPLGCVLMKAMSASEDRAEIF
ncbi:GDSL-type esterase/lipase family protein [Bradyrhizobium lablabi]|uniref:GDSL-type esterase/lipase family protein n=1 Tax=Bradyrhizobium lablabi TaxID=722472 RepID=UPI0032218AFF